MTRNCFAVIFASMSLAASAEASLYDRGNGMVYDSDRGITWLKDASYAKTSGYDSDGLMNLGSAKLFADGLIYAGFSDWVLPQVYPVYYEFPVETLLEVSLGNPYYGAGQTPLPNPGPFINYETQVGYWHRGAAEWSSQSWYYIYDDPTQRYGHYSGNAGGAYIAWPMRYGDVSEQLPDNFNTELHGGDFTSFTGWTVTGRGSAELVDRNGQDMVKLITGSPVNLMQLLDTPEGEFILSYDVDMSETWGQNLLVYLNSTQVDKIYNSTSGLIHREVPITNPALMGLSEVELRFTVDYSSSGKVAYLDNIAIVPEPATLGLLALGGLGLMRRRHQM